MKVGIIGYGFVGKALHNGFNSNVEVYAVDPKLKTCVSDLQDFSPDIVFICVPSPMNDNGTQDLSILNEVLEQLASLKMNSTIVLKSTILPDTIIKLRSSYGDFVFNPEFLREKHANQDFIKSSLIVFGGRGQCVNVVTEFYKKHTKCECKEYVTTDLVTASLIKYSINTFLATKVTFFNEINKIFTASNAQDSWENFTVYLSKDKRIGDSHMSVPGHDGKLGFGGACLPKDSRALIEYAMDKGIVLEVLSKAVKVNNNIRGQYNIDKRESDQNVNFLDKKK